jgi:soluble lytic murein transglycosylase-like protein
VFICVAFFVALLFGANPARAETVVLRNGQRLRVTGYERDGELMRLTIPGGRVMVRAEDVERIEPEDYFPTLAKTEPEKPYEELIRAAAAKYGVDEDLLFSVIAAESNFDAKAVSRKGAQGLMQLMPATARDLNVNNTFDAAQNIDGGAQYLRAMLERFGNDLRLALAAYNAGPEKVEKHRGVPPIAETRAYLERVMRQYNERKGKKRL